MKFFLLAIFLAWCCVTHAQSVRVPFTANQPSLSISKFPLLQKAGVKWVNCIFKDSRHFLWFGTGNGLFRFDGTNVVYLSHKIDDSLSLIGNNIVSMAEDKKGNLWIGTTLGACRMDATTFKCTQLTDINGHGLGYKLKFYIDGDDNIWAACDGGLQKFDTQKNGFRYVWQPKQNDPHYKYTLLSITTYNNEELVAGTQAGIVFINKKNFVSRRLPVLANGADVLVSKVYVDDHHELWAGTWGEGLLHLNQKTGVFEGIKWEVDAPNNVDNIVNDVIKVNSGGKAYLYVGTVGGLLKIGLLANGYTPDRKSLTAYQNIPGDDASIMVGSITGFLHDDEGTLWAGCDGDIGVARIQVAEPMFNSLAVQHAGFVFSMDTVNISGKRYYAICTWHNKTGLKLLDDSLREVKRFARLPAASGPDAVDIASVSTDKFNRVWVASWKGLTILDKNLQVVKTLNHATHGPDTLTREKINYAIVNGDSVWVASYKNGIDLFNIRFKRLKHYSLQENYGLREDLVWRFYCDRLGDTWLLGNAYLYKYSKAKDVFVPYFFSRDSAQYKPYAMAQKKDGTYILGCENGLVLFNSNTHEYKYIRSPLLEKNVPVNAVALDERDNVWFITDAALVYYDFAKRSFTIYDKEDGLDVGDGLYSLLYLGKRQLLIGQENKLVVFKAPFNAPIQAPTYAQITSLRVNDNSVNALPMAGGLVLRHGENRLQVDFACISYSKPEQNMFAYRLKDIDTGWIITPENSITFANLLPGHYVFEVKAANYAQLWSNVVKLDIFIRPPFWQTWWFLVLAIAILAGATYVVFKWRVGAVRNAETAKANIAKQMAQLEMKALRAQMNPHFIFNSLSSIQASIVTGNTDAASKYLSKFSKLIRLILENSGKQFISVKSEIASLTLYLELESFRFENFTYVFSIDPAIDDEQMMIPSMIIQPFVENALIHGFAKKIGDKQLKIDIQWGKGSLTVLVEDNGTGRPKATEVVSPERKPHHSMGVRLTEERLRLANPTYSDGRAIIFTDLLDEQGNPAGTRVKLILPIEK